MIENNTTTINSKQESLEYLLIIKGISKVYKKDNKEYKVLEDINFKIKKGEMIGIVGESGSGKSKRRPPAAGDHRDSVHHDRCQYWKIP